MSGRERKQKHRHQKPPSIPSRKPNRLARGNPSSPVVSPPGPRKTPTVGDIMPLGMLSSRLRAHQMPYKHTPLQRAIRWSGLAKGRVIDFTGKLPPVKDATTHATRNLTREAPRNFPRGHMRSEEPPGRVPCEECRYQNQERYNPQGLPDAQYISKVGVDIKTARKTIRKLLPVHRKLVRDSINSDERFRDFIESPKLNSIFVCGEYQSATLNNVCGLTEFSINLSANLAATIQPGAPRILQSFLRQWKEWHNEAEGCRFPATHAASFIRNTIGTESEPEKTVEELAALFASYCKQSMLQRRTIICIIDGLNYYRHREYEVGSVFWLLAELLVLMDEDELEDPMQELTIRTKRIGVEQRS
ncbi:hypothetical protein B0T16DRAFT_516064 [Cercophora newfieldiana]|uniref:Uncharacterized protein n=1 Tax=Cercophora newfieldiana TaxID=92897 RepID=A0AA40CJY3_9PEZI|nr:hypothetical protein B0T16DRAFT_516064 [Cercophora newfieldiana]